MRLGKTTTGLIAAAIMAWLGNGQALGGFVEEFTDKAEWISAVGRFTTIDFTGFPDGTFITDQYADLGILFTDGNDNIFLSDNAFPNDGAGLFGGGFTPIAVSFDTPQAWIAVDFPGAVQFELFREGELIYTSSLFGGGGVGFFAGLVSSELFDAAVILDPDDQSVFIDDLHFGVPAPGAIALLALASLFSTRRRRSGVTGAASTED
ncbi:MAG: hypothetical protein IH830_00025 [Planctomycetes bacterium]|nr:hypothetical protein [Planctomycetota bacterium]